MSVARRQHNIQFQLASRGTSWSLVRLHARGKLAVIERSEVDHEIVLDGKDSVRLEPWVVFGVDLCDAGFVAVLGDHQVDVSGTHRVAVESLEESP